MLCEFIRLTRRAKHWQNDIIENFGSARAKQSAAGFLFARSLDVAWECAWPALRGDAGPQCVREVRLENTETERYPIHSRCLRSACDQCASGWWSRSRAGSGAFVVSRNPLASPAFLNACMR